MSSLFGVLRVRNFRLHFTAQIVRNVGTWFQSITQALLVIELTGSGTALGLVTALQFTPTLLFGPYGGALSDRLPPRAVMMTTAGIAALLAAIMAVVTATGHITQYWIFGLALAFGCVQAFDRPTAQTFLYELVGPGELQKAVGLHSITQSSARMLGPALGGAAYSLLGGAACFAITSLSLVFVILSLLAMRSAELWPRAALEHEAGAQVRDGVRYAWRHPELRAPLLVNLLLGALAFNFMVVVTAMVRFEFEGSAAALGAAHALNAVGAVLGSLLLASLYRPARRHLAFACLALALAIAGNALAPNMLAFLIWAPIFGLAIGAYQTALLSSVQGATAPAMLGRMSGLLAFGSLGMTPIGSLIAGWLIDLWSARAAMALGACACLIGGLVLLRPLAQREAAGQSPA